MSSENKEKKSIKAIEKERKVLERREERISRISMKEENPAEWRQMLEAKVPDKIYINLEKAFCKAFTIIFEKGTGIIEKSYNQEKILENLQINNYAFQVKANRKSLRKVKNGVTFSNIGNMAATTVEGIGLGALGIGLPDIVVFIGVLLRGIYETALHYGFGYDTPKEQYFILKLMETAMQKADAWNSGNEEIDRMIIGESADTITEETVKLQIAKTSDAFATDMVMLKFIQGIPVVGMLGGCGNPVYYHKVMKYVRLKYQKRYLWELKSYKKQG